MQAPCQNAFGDHFNAGAGRDLAFEAHGVTHRLADSFAQRIGHALGRSARSKAAWLQHDDLLALEPRLHRTSASGTRVVLPAPGSATSTHKAVACECGLQIRDDKINGKVHGAGFDAGMETANLS